MGFLNAIFLKKRYICPMEKKILPLSRQFFRSLREDNCIYVDKTQHIYNLCTQGKMYFLSRPRRFGKSVLLSTMHELFLGSKDLFEGTWIADKWDWTQKSPVIHISFLTVSYEKQGLEAGLKAYLLDIYKEHKIRPLKDDNIKTLFFDLIKKLHNKHGKVVILIDEYDKAIIDYLEFHKIPEAKANQEVLALFYGALKEAELYIRLLFITGISKFTQVSLFSKLNNLTDLTINPNYATILGYTQQELEHYFADYINDTRLLMETYTHAELLEEIRIWYDGYSWDGKNRLYNPSGILSFFANQDFQGFWFQTGTPTFVVKKMLEEGFFQAENIETHINFLNQYSLDNLELTSLLFQTGYLTIKEKSKYGDLVLSYPNQEVKEAMYTLLMDDMGHTVGGGGVTVKHLKRAFMNNDLEQAQAILVSLFGGLAFDVYTHQNQQQVEGFYHGLIHILFKCLGLYMQSEVHSTKGRADSIVETPTHIYFLEFKINSDALTAFNQIGTKKYATPYTADSRIKMGIGINFNSSTKELDGWHTETLQ
jgi:Predicted AAA-ATPase/PD-(D/E)XK nuclease superfamily